MGLDCKANLTISGTKEDLELFIEAAKSLDKCPHDYHKGEIPISMEKLLPFSGMSEKTKAVIGVDSEADKDWKDKYYGCDHLLCFGTVKLKEVGPDLWEYSYGLESRGQWPFNFIHTISWKWPKILFQLSYGDSAYSGTGGVFACKACKVVQDSWEEGVWDRDG